MSELSVGNIHDSKNFESVLNGADDAIYSESGEAIPWPLALDTSPLPATPKA